MPNARDKSVDNTHLSIDTVENRYLIHRDYIAHCLRYSHAVMVAMKMRGDLFVLDVGCGKEMPFAKALYTNKIGANIYCGVDYNMMNVPEMLIGNGVFKIRLIKNADAANLTPELVTFEPNLVTMLEVFEHVEPPHGRAILAKVHELMAHHGTFLFSTPCFNGNPAGNHVAEPEYEIMGATLEDAGFAIVNHWGTFASIRDYRDELWRRFGQQGLDMFEGLRTYYDVNFLATVFAPLFPDRARNCFWELIKVEYWNEIFKNPYARKFPPRLEVKPVYSPTGSSSLEDAVLDQAMYDKLMARYEKKPTEVVVEGADGPAWPINQDQPDLSIINCNDETPHELLESDDGPLYVARLSTETEE